MFGINRYVKKNEAQLYCFNHNVDEMTNILTWTKHNLYKGRDGHDTIKFLLIQVTLQKISI